MSIVGHQLKDKDMITEENIWVPCESVAGIDFGLAEAKLPSLGFHLILEEAVPSVGWQVYGKYEMRVYCEDNIVVSIATYESLIFKDVDLIGCRIDKVMTMFVGRCFTCGNALDTYLGTQTPFDCDELGAQFWTNASGIIVGCTCDKGSSSSP